MGGVLAHRAYFWAHSPAHGHFRLPSCFASIRTHTKQAEWPLELGIWSHNPQIDWPFELGIWTHHLAWPS